MMYNTVMLERDLTDYFAAQLDLVVDGNFFRGQIPESIENGVALRVVGTPEPTLNDNPLYAVQIYGKFKSRDDAWMLVTKCADCIPVYGVDTEHFHIVFILMEGGLNAPVVIDDKGKSKQFASVNMRVSVLTRQA